MGKRMAVVTGGVALLLMLVVFGGGMMLDKSMTVSAERELNAPIERVFALLSSPAGVMQWWQNATSVPGHEGMAGMLIVRGPAPKTGVGSSVLFKVNDNVAEHWTLKSLNPPHEIVWEVNFQMFVSMRTLRLHPLSGGRTKVSWQGIASFESPMMRWMTLLPTGRIEQNFQSALQLLEQVAQAPPSAGGSTGAAK